MTVAVRAKFPAANAITTVNTASSITTSVTVVAGDVLVCHTALSMNGDSGRDLSSVANGVAADGSSIEKHANGQSDGFEQVFWWLAPSAGTYNVVTTVTGGAVDNLEQKVYAISGTNGAAPSVTTFAPTGTGTTSAASITSPTIPVGGLGLALFTAGSAFGSTGQTTECLGTASSPVWAASSIAGCSTAGANATVNFTAAITTPDWYAGIALAFASAAPVLIAATQSGTADTNSTTKTVPIPSGTSANSVIVCVIQTASPTAAITTVPSGFAPVTGSPFTITGVSGGENYSVYWKRSASGEGSGNYTWGFATSTWNMIEAFAVDGCRTTGDPFEDIEQSVSSAGTSIPSLVLTTTDNDMLVFIGLADANTHGTDWNPPTGPGTFTEVIDNDYNGISWYQDTASGSRTVSGATINNNLIHAQMALAFPPAGGGGSNLTQTPTDARGLVDSASFDLSKVTTEVRGVVDSTEFNLGKVLDESRGLSDDATPSLLGGSSDGLVFTRLVVT